jgi:hypothetical protein
MDILDIHFPDLEIRHHIFWTITQLHARVEQDLTFLFDTLTTGYLGLLVKIILFVLLSVWILEIIRANWKK